MILSFLQYIRYEKNYSSHTVLSYQTDIEQLRDFVVTQKGDFDPKKLTSDELREWIIALMDVGEKPSSVKRKISAVRSFYKFLNLKNLTTNNPTLKIPKPNTKGGSLSSLFSLISPWTMNDNSYAANMRQILCIFVNHISFE